MKNSRSGRCFANKKGRSPSQGYTVQTTTGPKRKTVYGKTRAEANQKLIKAMANRDQELVFDVENQTLGEYLAQWLNNSVKGNVKPVSFENYEWLVRNHIVPTLGRVKLVKLTPASTCRASTRSGSTADFLPPAYATCMLSCTGRLSRPTGGGW
jgi:hypothetical protein